MSKREFVYNFPSQADNAVKTHGTKPQAALQRQGFEIMTAAIESMEAVECGDADALQAALYGIGATYETALRMNERFHNVSPETYPRYGRAIKYDEGVDATMFFEEA